MIDRRSESRAGFAKGEGGRPMLDSDKQTYAGNNHLLGPRTHLAVSNPPFLLRCGDKEWLMEWHYYSGPVVLNKRTHCPVKNQPGERSSFWLAAQWWFDQGCRVVDGVGVWEEPTTEEMTCVLTGRRQLFWLNYFNLGPVRKL